MTVLIVVSSHIFVIQRFRYYDCLLVPKSSLIGQFPWHRVNLLVEYEHAGDSVPTTASLEHVVLKCTSDVFPGLAGSPTDLQNQGTYGMLYHVTLAMSYGHNVQNVT